MSLTPGAAAGSSAPKPDRTFDRLAYRDPTPVRWLIRALGPINRHLVLPRWLRIREIDLPAADLARLRAAVRPGTAAFLGPNHPEFMTDWMLDKEISRLVSPLMAHWASYEIVNASPMAQRFWLANNLISNPPGGNGREYSMRWALAGHGVLLHPEGTASWHAERVGRLLPGIVEMAWEACTGARTAGRDVPVFIVPVVWKLHFTHDVSRGLAREMEHIERRLGLPSGEGLARERRFLALQVNLLARQCARFEITVRGLGSAIAGRDYFDVQAEAATQVRRRLEARYATVEGDFPRFERATRRAIRERIAHDPEGARRDRALLGELQRLHGFTRERYPDETLTQEQVAENLKRTRASLVTRGFADALHNTVPVAVGPRVARIRVPEPIAVHEAWSADAARGESRRAGLLAEVHRRMQHALDALTSEIAPVVDRFRIANRTA